GLLSVWRLDEDGFNSADLSLLNPEKFGNFPGPWRRWTRRNHAIIGRTRVRSGLSGHMVEKGEALDHAVFRIHRYITTIANPCDEMNQAGLELLHATPLRGITRCRFRIRASLPRRCWCVRGLAGIFKTIAVIGERILSLSLVFLHVAAVQ